LSEDTITVLIEIYLSEEEEEEKRENILADISFFFSSVLSINILSVTIEWE